MRPCLLCRGCYDYARPFLLSIENPLEPSMDVGRNSYNVARVQQACGHMLHTLLHRINQVCVGETVSHSYISLHKLHKSTGCPLA